MASATSCREDSLEGIWHRAVKTNWAWKFIFGYWGFFVLGYISGVSIKFLILTPQIFLLTATLQMGAVIFVLGLLLSLPMTYWLDRNKVPAMLRFGDAGIALQLKTGLVLEAGWNMVKSVKYSRWGKLTTIRIRWMFYPYVGNFPCEVKDALVDRAARMRRGPPVPAQRTELSLEDMVDRRLEAGNRM